MENRPKIIVGVIIYNSKGEIFLAQSHKWGDHWIVPGGHLEYGEGLDSCIKREIKEETNLDITNIELIDIQESIFSKDFHQKKHMVFLDYAAELDGGDVVLNDELQRYKWLIPEDALKENLYSGTRKFIENFIVKKYD